MQFPSPYLVEPNSYLIFIAATNQPLSQFLLFKVDILKLFCVKFSQTQNLAKIPIVWVKYSRLLVGIESLVAYF